MGEALEDLIAEVPATYGWLVRSHDGDNAKGPFFANVSRKKCANTPENMNYGWGDTPVEAFRNALNTLKARAPLH